MTVEEYGTLFGEALGTAGIASPEGTALHRAAVEVLEMAAAYHSDGTAFFHQGDLVNALASFSYGYGWLAAGCAIGLIRTEGAGNRPPGAADLRMPGRLSDHLHEKTHRYRRMLNIALLMVEVGPDEGSPLHAEAGLLLSQSGSWYAEGADRLEGSDLAGALACFSYGYAWLDAGIRAGLLRILGCRDLFTV
jgi:uncharacterized protein